LVKGSLVRPQLADGRDPRLPLLPRFS
jgi:hypothetical protein